MFWDRHVQKATKKDETEESKKVTGRREMAEGKDRKEKGVGGGGEGRAVEAHTVYLTPPSTTPHLKEPTITVLKMFLRESSTHY